MLEALEGRRHMSVSGSVDLFGTLTVRGTSGPDAVEVTTGFTTAIVNDGTAVWDGGDVVITTYSGVLRVVIETGDGDDSITLNAVGAMPVTIRSGADNDTLIIDNWAASVTADAGDGDDAAMVYDEGVRTTTLDLGAGNDYAKVAMGATGLLGPTVVLGGDGDDVLVGSGDYSIDLEGVAWFDAGFGSALLDGGDGNDIVVIYNGNTTVDGGEGEDALLSYATGASILGIELAL